VEGFNSGVKRLTEIFFIDYLGNLNENDSVFNLKILCLLKGCPLADLCSIPERKLWKESIRMMKPYLIYGRSLFNSGTLPLKKL
jgi:hypothetical protein